MAGEIFIARQDTLENVQGTVNTIDTNVDTVNTTTTAVKTETESIKADTEALKLSTDSIKQIADTILERIGLTTDSGGGISAGSLFAKLNALLSSGGGISGFKYTQVTASDTTKRYTTKAAGFLLGDKTNYSFVSITNSKGATIQMYKTAEESSVFGIFVAGAIIEAESTWNQHTAVAHIFEFI